jgi:hypothetical protein
LKAKSSAEAMDEALLSEYREKIVSNKTEMENALETFIGKIPNDINSKNWKEAKNAITKFYWNNFGKGLLPTRKRLEEIIHRSKWYSQDRTNTYVVMDYIMHMCF